MDFVTKMIQGNLFLDSSSGAFDDLKNIGNKIIPNDVWGIIIQLVSTAILVCILAHFLVKPAKKFIQTRKDFIAKNLQEASSKNTEADSKLEEANKQLKEARGTSKEIIENAKVTALNEKDRIVNETKQEVVSLKSKAKEDIEMERNKMKADLTDEVVDVALLAAAKVVDREISDEDNRKIVSSFIKDNQ